MPARQSAESKSYAKVCTSWVEAKPHHHCPPRGHPHVSAEPWASLSDPCNHCPSTGRNALPWLPPLCRSRPAGGLATSRGSDLCRETVRTSAYLRALDPVLGLICSHMFNGQCAKHPHQQSQQEELKASSLRGSRGKHHAVTTGV